MSTVAQELWTAESDVGRAEDKIGDVLDALFGARCWDDFWTDASDSSIEISGVGEAATTSTRETLTPIWRLGFDRCWLHTESPGTRSAGEYFSASGS